MKIFITGQAGMIGFHAAKHLASLGHNVAGLDNFNDSYDTNLKEHRSQLLDNLNIKTIRGDINTVDLVSLFDDMDVVLHLAAHTNPRASLKNPQLYVNNNILGTQAVIDALKQAGVDTVVYASSSSVMNGQPLPFKEHDQPKHQSNPYSWSKWVNECQFACSGINKTVGLRFFTVYGPLGRPDMALSLFTRKIAQGQAIDLYNHGDMKRDFTYVDDIVQGIGRVIDHASQQTAITEIYNIGYGRQVDLMDVVQEIERELGTKAIRNLLPMHPADAPATWADISKIQRLGYCPTTDVATGVKKFVDWYRSYY